MSHLIACKGIVIREQIYAENDKFLVILTDTMGRVPVFCKGARSYKSKLMMCAQLFCYSDLVLYQKGENYWLKEASLIENFYGIREDMNAFALSQYLLEVVQELTRENLKDNQLQRLLLNTLYALEKKMKPLSQIKPVFELRACSLSGFMPDLVGCTVCGKYEDPGMHFAMQEGMLYCLEHVKQAPSGLVPVNPAVLKAMRWSVFAPLARLFAFSVPEEDLAVLDQLAENYLGYHVDKRFETLTFYRTMLFT
ncbi:MAG: DNA repair protein RecO [Clostridiales bacterium]|nr:DNA repair protein RecO [Clostridiales bacterium]